METIAVLSVRWFLWKRWMCCQLAGLLPLLVCHRCQIVNITVDLHLMFGWKDIEYCNKLTFYLCSSSPGSRRSNPPTVPEMEEYHLCHLMFSFHIWLLPYIDSYWYVTVVTFWMRMNLYLILKLNGLL